MRFSDLFSGWWSKKKEPFVSFVSPEPIIEEEEETLPVPTFHEFDLNGQLHVEESQIDIRTEALQLDEPFPKRISKDPLIVSWSEIIHEDDSMVQAAVAVINKSSPVMPTVVAKKKKTLRKVAKKAPKKTAKKAPKKKPSSR